MEKDVLKYLKKEVKRQLNEVSITLANQNNVKEAIAPNPDDLKSELKDKLSQLSINLPDDPDQLLILLNAVNNAIG